MIAKGCTNLIELNLSGCEFITNAGVLEIANHLLELQQLDLSSCWHITDESIEALATNCTKLTDINLTFCTRVSDKGAKSLIMNCPHLSTILLKSSNITNQTLNLFVIQKSTLKTLDVRRCYGVTEEALLAVKKGCKLTTFLTEA